MKSSWTGFHSPLAPGIDAFLAHKRALGCLFRVEQLSLRLFDRFLVAQPITTLSGITPDVVDAFLVSRPRHAPRSYNHLRGTLGRLFDWLAAHDSSRATTPTFYGLPRRPTTCTSWARTRSSCGAARSWPSHSPARLRARSESPTGSH